MRYILKPFEDSKDFIIEEPIALPVKMEADDTTDRHTNSSKTAHCNTCKINFSSKRSLSAHNSKFHKSKTDKSYTKSIESDENDNRPVHSSSHESESASENDSLETQAGLDNLDSQNDQMPMKRNNVSKITLDREIDHHTDISKTITCDKCQIKFSNKRSLSAHNSKFHKFGKINNFTKMDQNITKIQGKLKPFDKSDRKRKGCSSKISKNKVERMTQDTESDFSHTESQSDSSDDTCTTSCSSANDSGYEREGPVSDTSDVSDNESEKYQRQCSPSKWNTQRDARSFKDFFKFKDAKDGVGLNETECSLVDSIMLIDNLEAVTQLMEGEHKVVKSIFAKVRRYCKQD